MDLDDGCPPMPPNRRGSKRKDGSRLTAQQVWERDYQCVMMRRQEIDWQTIVESLGYASLGQAWNAYKKFQADYPRESAEEQRDLDLDRLERVAKVLMDRIELGDKDAVRAAEVYVKVQERRAKATGTDAPERREVTVLSEDTVDAALKKLDAEMAAKAQAAGVNLADLMDSE